MQYTLSEGFPQTLTLTLNPGQSVLAEPGSLIYMSETVEMKTQIAMGTHTGLLSSISGGIQRLLTGETFFVTAFIANTKAGKTAQLALSPRVAGSILPLDLSALGPIVCHRGAYFCSEKTVTLDLSWSEKLKASLLSRETLLLQKLKGSGLAFLTIQGSILPVLLPKGESILVDSACFLAMTEHVSYDIKRISGLKNWLFGKEGLYLLKLTGPGQVYLHNNGHYNRHANTLQSPSQSSKALPDQKSPDVTSVV